MANQMTNVLQHQNPQQPVQQQQRKHSQLHISSNPDDSLNELFHSSLHGSPTTHSLPYAQRKLPASFFRPPSQCSSAAHSRESSLDATFTPRQQNTTSGKPPTPIGVTAAGNSPHSSPASPPNVNVLLANKTTPPPPPPTSGLVVNHGRTRSLPASLYNNKFWLAINNGANQQQQNVPTNQQPPTMAQSPQMKAVQQQQNFHIRQHSYDINKIPLPEGWSMSFTQNGDPYFLNHIEKRTTWEDPRKEILLRELQNQNQNSLAQVAQRQINSNNGSNGGLAAGATFSSQPNVQQVLQQQQPQQQPAPQFVESNFDPANVPLPDNWKQTSTPNGDVYYVNMSEQKTSWFHPSIPRQAQLKSVQLKQQSSGVQPPSFIYTIQQQANAFGVNVNSNTNVNNNNNNIIPPELVAALENMTTESTVNEVQMQQVHQQQPQSMPPSQNIRDLELERERYRQRQEEILQSQLLKTKFMPFNNQSSDPFLSSSAPDCGGINHGRQQSLDSGLSFGSGGSHLTLNSCAIPNNGFGSDQVLNGALNAGGVVGQHSTSLGNTFSTDDILNSMDHFNNNLPQQQQNRQMNQLPNGHHQVVPGSVAGATMNHVDDLSQVLFDDLVNNIDMDVLGDVEELLNSNRENIMTWL